MNALLLMSGGFDSAVAAYLIRKKGLILDALHFSLEPFTSNAAYLKAKKISKLLGIKNLYSIRAGELFLEFSKRCNIKYYFILTKRFMLKVAEELSKRKRYSFIATGENLGQVSSQTHHSLVAISFDFNIPIVRPLLCFTKEEIINIAKEINIYEISKGPECCDILAYNRPITRPKFNDIINEEKLVDEKKLINKSLNLLKKEII